MTIVAHFYGLKLGGFTDVYECALTTERSVTIHFLLETFQRIGYRRLGRGFDGSFLFQMGPRREVAAFVGDQLLRIEDRYQRWVSVRLLPSLFRAQIAVLGRKLDAEGRPSLKR